MKALVLLLAFCACGFGEIPAQTPGPDQPDQTEFYLLAGDAAVRSMDAVSSLHDYHEPGIHETSLPDTFLRRPSVMWAYSLGEVGLQYLVARELIYRHHPRIAHWLTAADIVYDGRCGLRNLTMWHGFRTTGNLQGGF